MCKRKYFYLLLICLLISFSFVNTNTQSRYSKEVQAEFLVRRDMIQAELTHLKTHEWAGKYNVHGQFLFIAPESGFAYFRGGGDYDANWDNHLLNYGKIQFTDGKIKLFPELPNKEEVLPGYSSELLLIIWGERHYLVPTDEIIDYVNQQ